MKEKALTLLTLIFISLSILGFVYAQWNDIIVVRSTMAFGDLNMGFTMQEPPTWTEYHINPLTGQLEPGEYQGKDVGESECQYTNLKPSDMHTGKQAYETLIITINNAYPSYEVHCNFTLENIGTLPLHINETVISDPNGILTWDPAQGALVDANSKPLIYIVITPELVCNKLWPSDDPITPDIIEPVTLEAEIAVHITQNAEECRTYSFQVKIIYEVT